MNHRLLALIRKEFNQIRRDRRLAISLIVPPTLQLLLFGFTLFGKHGGRVVRGVVLVAYV